MELHPFKKMIVNQITVIFSLLDLDLVHLFHYICIRGRVVSVQRPLCASGHLH